VSVARFTIIVGLVFVNSELLLFYLDERNLTYSVIEPQILLSTDWTLVMVLSAYLQSITNSRTALYTEF